MTPPDSDPTAYVAAIILCYLELPETPISATLQDHRLARRWHEQGIPLQLAESALLLASLRRLVQTSRPATLVAHPLTCLLPTRCRRTPRPPNARQLPRLSAASNSIASSQGPYRRKSKKLRFQMIANRRSTAKRNRSLLNLLNRLPRGPASCISTALRKFFGGITSDQVRYDVVDSYGKLMELVK